MLPDDDDGAKYWLENLSEAEYDAYKAAQRRQEDEAKQKTHGSNINGPGVSWGLAVQ